MEIKNYCVIIMGDTKNVIDEIEKISDNKPNILDAKGIIIATLSSALTVGEINEWFKLQNRSFFVFDLNPKYSGYNITKEEIHEGLFGFIKESDSLLSKRMNDLLEAIEDAKIIKENSKKIKTTKPIDVKTVIRPRRITEEQIENMTLAEKQEAMNKIIDSGVENFTDYDKKMLSLLAK